MDIYIGTKRDLSPENTLQENKTEQTKNLVFSFSVCIKSLSNYIIKHLVGGLPLRCLHFNLGILDPVLSNKIFLTKFGGLEQNF